MAERSDKHTEKRNAIQSFVSVDVKGLETATISNTEYHSDTESVSKTMLSYFHHSPLEYWMHYVGGVMSPPQIKAGLIGSVCHDVLLLGKQLGDVALTYPPECLKKNGAINPKPAAIWRASLDEDQYGVKQQDFDRIEALLYAIKDHEVVSLISSASSREQPVYWTDDATGLKCRCRPDFLYDLGDEIVIYDLKFTDQFFDFWRTARNFRYWMQDGHYSRGVSRDTGKPVKFVFWAVESQFPFRVARHEYDQQSRENAWVEVGATLERLKACHESGDWTDKITRETNTLFFQAFESSPELDWS